MRSDKNLQGACRTNTSQAFAALICGKIGPLVQQMLHSSSSV